MNSWRAFYHVSSRGGVARVFTLILTFHSVGTPAAATAYMNSPHHASPHPRQSYQHFFDPNVPLPSVNGGGGLSRQGDLQSPAAQYGGGQQHQVSAPVAHSNSAHSSSQVSHKVSPFSDLMS